MSPQNTGFSRTVFFCKSQIIVNLIVIFFSFFEHFQKTLPALTTFVRNASGDKSLKEVLAEKIPAEQENVKAFRKSHGATKVGEVTVDMVRNERQKKKT